MFSRIRLPPLTLLSIVAWQLLQCAIAADGIWVNPGSSSWGASVNWFGGTIPSGAGVLASFNSIDLTANATVTLDGTRTVGYLVFGDSNPTNQWSVRSGGGGPLTLDALIGIPLIQVHNELAIIGARLAGDDGFFKDGTGTLLISGDNTYTGPTLVSQGTLKLGKPPVFPTGMQIMPLGDSITYGFNGSNAGYRGPLYSLLLPLSAEFRYIGTATQLPGFLPVSPIDQRRHEGHPSYNLQDVSNNLDGFDNARFLEFGGAERNPNGGYWFPGGNGTGRNPIFPDVITMMLGTNDLLNQQGVEARLRVLLDKITIQRPATKLLVAKLTASPTLLTQTEGYNQILEDVVAEYITAGKNIHLVDLNTNFPSNGLFDQVHPNDTGFNWMAIQWHEALIRAFTESDGQTLAIPATSPVTVYEGATLDLAGMQASTGDLINSGTLELGANGELNSPIIQNLGTGKITGSGTVRGSVTHFGLTLGDPGDNMKFIGNFTNNRTIDTSTGANLRYEGVFLNNGTVTGGLPVFAGGVTNNGVIRVTGGAILQTGGTFVNNGILDMITANGELPANFINNGIIIGPEVVKTESITATESSVNVSIISYSGHIYQLQASDDLEDNSWSDLGPPQDGVSGRLLNFTVARDPAREKEFYRIRVFP